MTHHRATTTAAIILSLAAAGAPTASAMPAGAEPGGTRPPALVYSYPDKAMIPPAASVRSSGRSYNAADVNAYGHTLAGHAPSVAVASAGPRTGFDWGDAGVGAAGGLALSIVGLGATLAASHRRNRRSAALTS